MSDAITLRPFEQGRFDRLVDLARTRFDAGITQPEARILMHSAAAYFLPEPSETESHPEVRSEFLRWLMTDAEAARFIDPKGVRIWSVTIPAPLDLQGCTIPHPVHFLWSNVEEEVVLFAAKVKGCSSSEGTSDKDCLLTALPVADQSLSKGRKVAGPST